MAEPVEIAETPTSKPRSMRFPAVREARRARLGEGHIAPLTAFVRDLRAAEPGVEFPDFDPADGGADARILFLMEKPGPMTSDEREGRAGSGFISRDNDDPTAEAIFNFMSEAGIEREDTVLWNVVPGWNGTRQITRTEMIEGVAQVGRLLELLPRVEVIVLVGKRAARAQRLLAATAPRLRVIRSPHPSPIVRASRPEEWRGIPAIWASAREARGAPSASPGGLGVEDRRRRS